MVVKDVRGFWDPDLSYLSDDILQLLDLFLQWDWSTYLADYGQPTCKYLRVNPVTALTLLEKWVPIQWSVLGGGDGRLV